MNIRFAVSSDIPGMIALLKQVGQVHHDGRPDLFRSGAQKYDEKALLALLRDPERPIFIADDGGVAGYAFCIVKEVAGDPVLCDCRSLYIDDLCVDESRRGSGIGKALLSAVTAYAKAENFYNITLNVWSCNESALRFYESCGLAPQKIGMELLLEDTGC